MKTRRATFTEVMVSARPSLSAPGRVSAAYEQPTLTANDITDAQAHIWRILADALACGAFGLFGSMLVEGISAGRVNGFRLAYILTGAAGVGTRVVGSVTIHEWRDWVADVFFARSVQQDQRERHETAFQRVETAKEVAAGLSHQPSAEDELINRAIVRVLGDYYNIVGHGKIPGKLWSRRTLQSRYNLGEFTNANAAVREAMQPIEDGQSLKPSTFDAAFIALFGTEPRKLRGPLKRCGQNPARGDPVFVAKEAAWTV